jgi:hypothetical protein
MSTSLWGVKGRIYELLQLRRDTVEFLAFTPEQEEDKLASLAVIDNEIRAYVVEEIKTNPQTVHTYMLESKARQAALEMEGRRIDGLLASEQGEYARAEELVLETLNAIREKKLPVMGTLRRQNNGGVLAVEVVQENLVPEGLKRYTLTMRGDLYHWLWSVVTEWEKERPAHPLAHRVFDEAKSEPDISAIRAELERGEGVPGCVLKERGEHLRCS